MDHRAKLEWARHHLNALDRDFRQFSQDEDAHAMTIKFDPERQKYIATLRVAKPQPDDWSLRLGDILHNIRSSLDSLTYALAIKNLRRAPTLDEAKHIQFVIADRPRFWRAECGRWLRHLHNDAQAAIERLQPYRRRKRGERHPLAALRDLSNVDKHRHVILVAEMASEAGVSISGQGIPPGTVIRAQRVPFVDGTEVATWNFKSPDGSHVPMAAHPPMDVHGHATVDIVFPHAWPAWGGSVMGFLPALHDLVLNEVFPPLEALL